MNGVSVGGLCFTGGLFSLDNAQQPGFRLDTPSGWYYGTCSITVLSIIIIAASALCVLLITILTGVAVCVYLRRRAKRLAGMFDCGCVCLLLMLTVAHIAAGYSQLHTDPDAYVGGSYSSSAVRLLCLFQSCCVASVNVLIRGRQWPATVLHHARRKRRSSDRQLLPHRRLTFLTRRASMRPDTVRRAIACARLVIDIVNELRRATMRDAMDALTDEWETKLCRTVWHAADGSPLSLCTVR